MKNQKNKSKEPFPPENTPTPPQVMDASKDPIPPKDEIPGGDQKVEKKQTEKSGEKKKLLGESPLEIDDETTI
jgi:hypothetical protein